MGINIDMSQLISKLDELDRKIKNDVSKNALNSGAEVMLSSQKSNCPKDTGKLESSLEKGKYTSGANPKIQVGIQGSYEDVIRYGYYQEYGSEVINGKKWMKKSFNESIGKSVEAIKKSIIKDIF